MDFVPEHYGDGLRGLRGLGDRYQHPGEILYATDSDLYHKQIPDRVVQQILQQGHYNGITNLGGSMGPTAISRDCRCRPS